MSSGYAVTLDPNDFSRFTGCDPRHDDTPFFNTDEDDLTQDELEELEQEMLQLFETENYRSNIEPLLDRIPAREADIIELYFLHGKRQADIATIFSITQAAVSYRLGRGILRIKFLLDLPSVTREQMMGDLSKVFPLSSLEPEYDLGEGIHIDVCILVSMWETTCQSAVAEALGLSQGHVRHRFFQAVKTLQDKALEDPEVQPYADIFNKISAKKFNILREVKLPQWSNRGGNEIA